MLEGDTEVTLAAIPTGHFVRSMMRLRIHVQDPPRRPQKGHADTAQSWPVLRECMSKASHGCSNEDLCQDQSLLSK